MFHSSSQRKHWMFSNPDELQNLRIKVNSEYVERFRASKNAEVVCLTVEDEKLLVDYYQRVLVDLQGKFQPPLSPMPSVAIATAVAYMKRFYLKTSVMDHSPRDMYLVFLYMACKVEEYNISAEKFVCILPPDRREKALDFILSHELLLMQLLDFHMTIHNAYRPLEGFIIDMKTRLGINPDQWRSKAEYFLLLSLRTDACFFYPPSQLALAALHFGCDGNDAINYMASLGSSDKNRKLIEQVKNIAELVSTQQPLITKDEVKALEQKLKACRNPDNNHEGNGGKRKKNEKKMDNSDVTEGQLVVPMEISN